ncbi:MAG: hypothetical protein KDJ52_04955 [Anaerolineae bacterium]|nr:hypothetical protein [Anaerolineae bacterium]
MHTIKQQRLTDRKYGPALLIAVVSISLVLGISGWINDRMIQEAIYGENSPVSAPWEWFGIACVSDIQHPGVPFTVDLMHAPGKSRNVVDEAIQNLPSRNGTPDDSPYNEEMLQAYLIMETQCFDSWQKVHESWSWLSRGPVDDLLPADRTPTEADYRAAILQTLYPDEFEIADRIFPLEAKIHSTVERWK